VDRHPKRNIFFTFLDRYYSWRVVPRWNATNGIFFINFSVQQTKLSAHQKPDRWTLCKDLVRLRTLYRANHEPFRILGDDAARSTRAPCVLPTDASNLQLVVGRWYGTRVEQVSSSFQKVPRARALYGSSLRWWSALPSLYPVPKLETAVRLSESWVWLT